MSSIILVRKLPDGGKEYRTEYGAVLTCHGDAVDINATKGGDVQEARMEVGLLKMSFLPPVNMTVAEYTARLAKAVLRCRRPGDCPYELIGWMRKTGWRNVRWQVIECGCKGLLLGVLIWIQLGLGTWRSYMPKEGDPCPT